MATAEEPTTERMDRGLLTQTEREILRGERDVDNREERIYDIRYKFRQRLDNLDDDLDILRAAGEEELVNEFDATIGRVERLEAELEALKEQLE
jgi:hypothetical protein